MLQYFSNLVLICLFVKIVPKRPLLMSVCHVCHNQRGIEENEGPDPEIPQSPPQPYTNPEPSKPPMVYYSKLV